jgi:tRNA(fMet)-specific endonuclease VapC
MLDTDTVSFALRGEGQAGNRLLAQSPSSVCISSIFLAELSYGAAHRKSAKLHRLIERFAEGVQVEDFDAQAATRFGTLAPELAHAGSPIGDFDTLIAAHALTLDLTLVTHNLRHFSTVPGLRTESWR